MDFEFLPWHWIVLGFILAIIEIFLASFFILWFGVAAIIVGTVLWLIPISVPTQIVSWAVLSGLLAVAWFRYFKPLAVDRTKAGLSKEQIVGETGQVVSAPNDEKRGKMRFPAPVLGDDEWMFISTDNLKIGDKVVVSDVSGNTLIVKAFTNNED
ncbi:MAG: NfeD family protein [Pseudomonadota bacterium]